jgi:hypothetical protein
MATSQGQKLYSITVFGYKKEGMNEKEYHDYISKTHAGHLKALLAKNDIVSYTMVSKTGFAEIHPIRASQPPLYMSASSRLMPSGIKATQHHGDEQASARTDIRRSSPDWKHLGL